jgi:transcriptional regulator with XRE-family HTH domain
LRNRIGGPIVDPVNWAQLISELMARKWTQSRIADRVGVSQPTISELANGKSKSTSYEIGNKLTALHKEVMSQPVEPEERAA